MVSKVRVEYVRRMVGDIGREGVGINVFGFVGNENIDFILE